jgi:hypothetical protein
VVDKGCESTLPLLKKIPSNTADTNKKGKEKQNNREPSKQQHQTRIPQRELQDVGGEYLHLQMKLQPQEQQNQDLVGGYVVREWKLLAQVHHPKVGQVVLKEVPEKLYAAFAANEQPLIHHNSHRQVQIDDAAEKTQARINCGNLCAVYANLNRNLLHQVRSRI